MYRDLDPKNWPDEKSLVDHPLISKLLNDGFRSDEPLCDDDDKIDNLIAPIEMVHVVDADSSQTVAIEEVKKGRNMVIQGPPGTGKSQTITNLIAAAVKEGKKVLFVAEKMAALDVVKRRLENIELGDICFELHSRKANKKHALEELKKTLALSRPVIEDIEKQATRLKNVRDHLNAHTEMLHSRCKPSDLTPYRIIGELVQLNAQNVNPPDFEFSEAPKWNEEDLRRKSGLVQEISERVAETGTPNLNPWRGTYIEVILPPDATRLRSRLTETLNQLESIERHFTEMVTRLSLDSEFKIEGIRSMAHLGAHISNIPPADRRCFASIVWTEQFESITDLLETGQRLAGIEKALTKKVVDAAWSTELATVRNDLAAHGDSLFRFLNGGYRRAQATLRGLMTEKPPKALIDRLTIVDGLIAGENCRNEIDSLHDLGKSAFGTEWRNKKSDWEQLDNIVTWWRDCETLDPPENILRVVAELQEMETIGDLAKQIAEEVEPFHQAVEENFQSLELNTDDAFSTHSVDNIHLSELKRRFKSWLNNMEGLTKWIALRTRLVIGEKEEMGPLIDRIRDGRIGPDEAVSQFRYAYFEAVMREISRQNPDIAAFDGKLHSEFLQTFKQLDLERIELSKQEVALAHFSGVPRGGTGGVGEIGIIRREIEKRRRHLPLRKLMSQAGAAIQAIKPVFMMSPMSVAQFLSPGTIEFDLLLIDEASQVRPVDALGAIARSRQIVVVGDDKQLPPTRFFARGIDDGLDEDDEIPAMGDLESILGLCSSQGMPDRMLRWHYRSRHHSLIAVSNHEFYDDRLYVVPSPFDAGSGLGLSFQHVPDGIFDRGGSATNKREARVVAEAIIDHARRFPNLSLGVGTFSIRQKEAILDELEHLWRTETDVKDFFATGSYEPFFVKNLENIQGDERDVILLSVGYGRDSSGFFGMNFGPLSADGGERRLNVLISRARERCKVFSSITADDIDLNRTKGRGPAALKTFLNFAHTGILSVGRPTGKGFDSPFEEEVAKAIRLNGYEVEPQVGIAGFFIDLAIIDPENSGRYLLGVECDGAAYHSARSARDRDRLRQQVLEDHGWIIHRVWSTDWFYRPEEEIRKILSAIENAKIQLNMVTTQPTEENAPPSQPEISSAIQRETRTQKEDNINESIGVSEYIEANFDVTGKQEPHEIALHKMVEIVTRIVEIEGPIHQDEIARRVKSLWGLERTGNRIVKAVNSALTAAKGKRKITRSENFFNAPQGAEIKVRDRSTALSASLRQPNMLPPSEIRTALRSVVKTHVGIAPEDATITVARLFGFKSTSAQLQNIIQKEIRSSLKAGTLTEQNKKLYCTD